MGKKSKRSAQPSLEDVLERPWCFYCERDFDDLKILISHQRAKHFKCLRCSRRLNTVGGLSVHLNQVHKETLTDVEDSLPNRNDVTIEIFGMEGIPEEVLLAHHTRVTQLYFSSDSHRANTGNPPPGGQPPAKKTKIETPEEIKERLKIFKAQREAAAAGLGNGNGTSDHAPDGAAATKLESVSPPHAQNTGWGPPESGFNTQHGHVEPTYSYQGFPAFGQSPVNHAPFHAPTSSHMPFTQSGPSYPGPPAMPYSPVSAPAPAMGNYHAPTAPPTSFGSPMSALGTTSGLPQPPTGLPQRPTFAAPNLSKEEMAKMHGIGISQPQSGGASSYTQPQSGGAPSYTGLPVIQSPITHPEIGDSVDELIRSVTNPQSSFTPDPTYDRRAKPLHELKGYNGEMPDASPGPTVKDEPIASMHDLVPNASSKRAHDNDLSANVGSAPDMGNGEKSALHPSFNLTSAAAPEATTQSQLPTKKRKTKDSQEAPMKLLWGDNEFAPEQLMGQKGKKHWFDREAHEGTETVLGDIGSAVTGGTDETIRDPADRGV